MVLALILPLVGALVSRGQASVLNISYGLTDSSIGDGTASGTIFDNTNQIGTWTISNFAFTTRTTDSVPPYAATVGTVTASTPNNPYGKPGVGILISGDGDRVNGVMSIQYTVGWSLNPGYNLDSASFWGKYPNTVGFYGPAQPIGSGGSIFLSGFSGQGVVSDPSNKLQAADGYLFNSGENLNGWSLGPTQGTAQAGVDWQLTAPSAASYTFTLDYDGQGLSSANEGTAFNLNIVPEPSVGSLLLVGVAWVLGRRRKS
jgi:hypothetical protein